MRRLTIIILLFFLTGRAGALPHQPSTPGVIVEAIEGGSAPDVAGLKVGDALLSWSRSSPGSSRAIDQGDFRTPFDARAFEIEQLPRGGTAITALRDGKRIEMTLMPGFWGTTVRPIFTAADLQVYTDGVSLASSDPDRALTAWNPLIERRLTPDDATTSAWMLTRAGAAFAAMNNIDRADELFGQAASIFRMSANPWLEAMVWEAEARACFPEPIPGPPAKTPTRLRLDAGLRADEKAAAIRVQLGRSLAAAESELHGGYLVWFGAQRNLFVPEKSAEDRSAFQQAGGKLEHALAVIAAEASDSFAHARALARRASFVGFNWGPRSSDVVTVDQAMLAKVPGFREARRILEKVAPTHTLLLLSLGQLDADPTADKQELARRMIQFGVETNNRVIQQNGQRALAMEFARRGQLGGAMAAVDDLKQMGATPTSVADFIIEVAKTTGDRGDIDGAIHTLEDLLNAGNLPPLTEKNALNRLANWYGEKGDLAAAENTLVTLLDRIDETDQIFLQAMLTLANLAADRGEFASADEAAARGLAVAERDPRANARLLVILNDMRSAFALTRGDKDAAIRLLERAVAVSALEEGPQFRGDKLNRQLRLAGLKEDSAAVLDFAKQALALDQETEPGTSDEAISLHNVALAFMERDEYEAAVPYLKKALELRRRLDSTTLALPETLGLLGMAEGKIGSRLDGLAHLDEAMALLEDRRLRPGAGPSWGGLSGSNLPLVHFYAVDLLVQDRQIERAFDVVERSRARGLLAMMAGRSVAASTAVPPALLDERRRSENDYDQKQAEISGMSSTKDASAIDTALVELHTIQMRLNDLDRRIAAADPRAAALEHPTPLTLAQARTHLDPGTVLLSYMVGPYRTYLFVVSAASTNPSDPGVTVYPIDAGEPQLRQSVKTFQTLINWDPQSTDHSELLKRGRSLYDQLVRPAESQIRTASRVLLSLDGPLHGLPFAALVRGDVAHPQYLAEWKALTTTTSMSVYAEIRRARRPASATAPIVTFADPTYPAASDRPNDAEVSALLRAGATLTPLPGARREAAAIAELFGARAKSYLGNAATEARAASVGSSARIIHMAVHGILNEQLPLNSALAFSIPVHPAPGEPNGLLQAWEIFEHVRIDADLVTLSACESALGDEVTGEGLVGLTRAFLFAGARSVVASLWKVADGPTAELMKVFYTNLRNGQSKDQALRNAEIALIRLGRSPAHWAAFTLTGDWK